MFRLRLRVAPETVTTQIFFLAVDFRETFETTCGEKRLRSSMPASDYPHFRGGLAEALVPGVRC